MPHRTKDRPTTPKPAITPRPDLAEQAYLLPDGQGVRCRVCGAELTFTFPVPLGAFAKAITAFAKLHQGCQAQPKRGDDE